MPRGEGGRIKLPPGGSKKAKQPVADQPVEPTAVNPKEEWTQLKTAELPNDTEEPQQGIDVTRQSFSCG